MVCISCVVIPFLLWVFHKFIQPFAAKYLPWLTKKGVEENQTDSKPGSGVKEEVIQNGGTSNGELKTANGIKAESAGGGSKKEN